MAAVKPYLDDQLPDLQVKSVGVKWFHPAGFLVDRPNGSGDFAFMQWLTRARIRVNGKTTLEREGGCIIFRPSDPQWFGGDVFTPFGNNWFHFQGLHSEPFLDSCGIPLNQVIHLRDSSFVEPILNLFMRESMNQPKLWQRMIRAGVERFFVEMARAMERGSVRLHSGRSAELKGVLEDLRYLLKERCAVPWTLKEMADRVHLSPSRFSRLYRDFFGISPIDDLIGMRIAKAEYYLCLTNMPIGHVAGLCGFSDLYYFSRLFKQKTGESPAAFRLSRGGEFDALTPLESK